MLVVSEKFVLDNSDNFPILEKCNELCSNFYSGNYKGTTSKALMATSVKFFEFLFEKLHH